MTLEDFQRLRTRLCAALAGQRFGGPAGLKAVEVSPLIQMIAPYRFVTNTTVPGRVYIMFETVHEIVIRDEDVALAPGSSVPCTIDMENLPKILRLATAAKRVLLDIDLDRARARPYHSVEFIDQLSLLELADALDALTGDRSDNQRTRPA